MGVVNTTYTFSGTDTITSAKLNNIIDDTTFTSDAIQGTTLQVVSPGKLAVNAGGITSNELASGAVTQAKVASGVVGTGPLFYGYCQFAQNIAAGAGDYKVNLTEGYDTNNNFTNSRFTATVPGYYLFTGSTGGNRQSGTTAFISHSIILKNGFRNALGSFTEFNGGALCISSVSTILFMNVNDWVELWHYQNSNINGSYIVNDSTYTYFTGCLIRSA
jgi:hypothetical protein